MIIDAHMHVDDIPALGWKMTADLVVSRLDEAGIDKGWVMTIVDAPEVNPDAIDWMMEEMRRFPGRLEGFARLHPWYGKQAVELLEHAFAIGYKGLKFHGVTNIAHPTGEESLNLIRCAAEHNAPTLFHCGDEPLTTPLTVAGAAARVPHATIILGHMGAYLHSDEAIEVAERHENVILETSGMPYPHKIAEAVRRVGAERVMFASDGPGCSPRIDLEKVRCAGLSPADEALVIGGNAQRLLDGVVA